MKHKLWIVLPVFVLLGLLVLLGGWDRQQVVAAPQPDEWLSATSLPEPLAANLVQCADDPDSFYMVGGVLEGNVTSNKLYRYDIGGSIVQLANLPEPRRAVGVACYQGKIYVAGGFNFPGFDSLFIYDISGNYWVTGPSLPDIVWGAGMGAWDGKLYLVGGSRIGYPYTPVSRVDVFDINSGVWTAGGKQDMPTAASFFGVAQDGPYLYAVGGYSGDIEANVDQTQRYDMATDQWESGPTFTSARALAPLAVTASHLYMLGGDLDGGTDFDATDLVEVLDLSAWPGGAWIDLGDSLPMANIYPATTCSEALSGGEIWAVGGGDANVNPYDEVYYRTTGESCADFYFGDLTKEADSLSGLPGEVVHYVLPLYNTGTETETFDVSASGVWTVTLPVTTITLNPGETVDVMVDVEIPLDVAPGDFDLATVTVTSQSDPAMQDKAELTTSVLSWMEREPILHPLALSAHVQCVDDPSSLYVIGGADGYSSPTNLAYRYDVLGNSWEQLAPLPSSAYGLTGACVDGKIYIVDWSTSLKIYDIASNTWTSEVGVPRFTEGAAMGAWGGNLYLVGGTAGINYEATDEVDIYDIADHAWHAAVGTPMPVGVDYAGVVQVGQYLYILGGGSYIYQEVYLVQRYDMAIDSWLTADYPSGLDFPASTATGSYLYVMGGDPPGDEQWTSSDLVQRLALDDWVSGAWEDIHVPLPKIAFGGSSYCTDALAGGEIWHIGGGDGATGIVYTDTLYLPAEPCVHYGVELLAPEGGSGEIGGSVEYELTITNTGTITDYYGVTVETTWPVGADRVGDRADAIRPYLGGPGPVGPGESITITIGVDIPGDVLPGDEGVSEITVESLRDPSIAALGEITTTASGWHPRTGMPHPLVFSAHVQCPDDPNILYVIGGADDWSSPTNYFFRYDVLGNSWGEPLAPLPSSAYGLTGACVDGKIYVVDWSTSLKIYDIASNTWASEGGVPRFTEGAAMGAWGGNLYLVGGAIAGTDYQATNQVDIYDIATHTWSQAAGTPMPQATDYAGVVQLGPYLYIVGGMSYIYENVFLIQRYDMATDSWQIADYPSGMVNTALTATGEYLYALGGDPPEDDIWTSSNLVEQLSIEEWSDGEWQEFSDPLIKLSVGASNFCTDGLTGGEIWHIGGADLGTGIVYSDTFYHEAEPCWQLIYQPAVDPVSDYKTGAPGETLEYILTMTNDGTVGDAFDIALSGNTWTTTVPAATGWLEPGETEEVLVTVNIPPDAPPEAEDVAVVRFTSQGDPEVSATATLTSKTYFYGVEVTPENAEMTGMPGDTLTYTLLVTNTGQAGDWYSIVLSGNLWTTEAPTETVWLEVGVTATVEVVVHIPLDAMAGEWDVAVLTITSQHDPEQYAVVTLTSRVPVWRTYLAIVLK